MIDAVGLQMADGMGGMGWMGWMFAALMMLFWLLILVALAGGIYWLFTRLFGSNTATGSTQNVATGESPEEPIDILNKRYAQGEIDDEEYTRRKERLRKSE
jgi:putative membrane protein